MMTDAPVMKPEMTECDRKLVSQPSRKSPTAVYMTPASSATCVTVVRACVRVAVVCVRACARVTVVWVRAC